MRIVLSFLAALALLATSPPAFASSIVPVLEDATRHVVQPAPPVMVPFDVRALGVHVVAPDQVGHECIAPEFDSASSVIQVSSVAIVDTGRGDHRVDKVCIQPASPAVTARRPREAMRRTYALQLRHRHGRVAASSFGTFARIRAGPLS